ncbi:MAG TPA: hypothetical protein VF638_05585 [Sphingomonas sp.]|jgi:hypothetical protein
MPAGVQGLAEAYSFLGNAGASAREELGVELAIIGREILAAQRADAPKATGKLDAALSLQLLLANLKVRIGLLLGGRDAGKINGRRDKGRSGGPFYGRIVEFGRRAQTVLVTRRIKRRRVKGNGRNGTIRTVTYATPKRRMRRRSSPNAGSFVGDPYKLRVQAKEGRPFVAQPLLREVADQHIGEYWGRVLARMGGA